VARSRQPRDGERRSVFGQRLARNIENKHKREQALPKLRAPSHGPVPQNIKKARQREATAARRRVEKALPYLKPDTGFRMLAIVDGQLKQVNPTRKADRSNIGYVWSQIREAKRRDDFTGLSISPNRLTIRTASGPQHFDVNSAVLDALNDAGLLTPDDIMNMPSP